MDTIHYKFLASVNNHIWVQIWISTFKDSRGRELLEINTGFPVSRSHPIYDSESAAATSKNHEAPNFGL